MSELPADDGSKRYGARPTGAPAEAQPAQRAGFAGRRSRSEMSELSPKGEARDMELAATRFT